MQERVRKQHPAETGLQERLGRLLGSIWERFGNHVWSQNRSAKGSRNQLNFGSAQPGPGRQGGVGRVVMVKRSVY